MKKDLLSGSKFYRAAILSICILAIVILFGCREASSSSTPATSANAASSGGSTTSAAESATNEASAGQTAAEVEATEFQGVKLTPIKEQGNNALSGTKNIDKETYKLTVDGLVENPLALTYSDLLAYPEESWLMEFNCVEGWNFTAKWTGPHLSTILNDAKIKPDAKIAIFYTADVPEGYTSLDLGYIRDNDILLALKLNDVTLSAERGFPFQVAAKSKFGYKWAKWVVRIELSSDVNFRGYWESAGYSNNADENGPAFDSK
jgi:DMSO/TMAO reductase YedYZ molybdopterin-dependent catalytic subunit